MKAASKWIRNYLIGKKEEKYKIDTDSMEYKIESSKVKRKWSFGRIKSKAAVHKFSRSFDSVDSAKLQIQSVEVETQVFKSVSKTQHVEITAATRVQAAFRSYLARKALHALRGLVKLQALVRGHLVRKRTTATLRGMHALMAIQVRARIHRIQTAEEANLLVAKQSSQHRQIPQDEGLIPENKDTSLREMQRAIKSRSGPLDRSHVKSTEHGSMTFYSKRKYQYKENTLITEPSSAGNTSLSELNPTKAISTCQRRSVSWAPNYMTKTESSRAKARSQSEPKQRPKLGMRQKNKYLSSDSSRFNHGSLDHWVINYWEPLTDSKSDSFSSSMATSDSYH